MGKLYCEKADDFMEYKVETRTEKYNVMDKDEIEIEEKVAVCEHCGDVLDHADLEDENLTRLYNKYREKHNMLFPEEIKQIRNKYELTQREMSQLLGWGEITYHRYENGSLPDKTHHNQLLLIQEPRNVKTILENQDNKLEKDVERTLKKRVNKLIEQDNKVEVDFPNELYKKISLIANKNKTTINNYVFYLITEKYHEIKQEDKTKKAIKQSKEKLVKEQAKQEENWRDATFDEENIIDLECYRDLKAK